MQNSGVLILICLPKMSRFLYESRRRVIEIQHRIIKMGILDLLK